MLCEYTKFSAIFRLPLSPMRLSSVSHTLKSWQGFMTQVFVITSNHGIELSGLHLYKQQSNPSFLTLCCSKNRRRTNSS